MHADIVQTAHYVAVLIAHYVLVSIPHTLQWPSATRKYPIVQSALLCPFFISSFVYVQAIHTESYNTEIPHI